MRITGKKIGTNAEREKRDQIIIELYKQGIQPKKIAEYFGITASTVGQIVRRHGVPAQNENLSAAGKRGAEIAAAKKNAAEVISDGLSVFSFYTRMNRLISAVEDFVKEVGEIFADYTVKEDEDEQV